MGLPYARENIINQTAMATSCATQSLTKKSLLTAPYYHSLSCDMNITDENLLNVPCCTFTGHFISYSKSCDPGVGSSFLLTQIFLFIYPSYPNRFVSRGHILGREKIIRAHTRCHGISSLSFF